MRTEGRLRHFHRKHAGEPFAHVFTGNVKLVAFLENVIVGDVLANDIAHGHAQTCNMRAAVALRNIVRISGQRLVVRVVPLHGDFHINRNFFGVFLGALLHHGLLDVDRILVNGLSGGVFKENKALDATLAFEKHVTSRAFIGEFDVNARIQEREFAQSVEQRFVVEFDDRLKDLGVRQKVHFRASLGGGPENGHWAYFHHFASVRILLFFNNAIDHCAVIKAQGVCKAVAVHLEFEPL